MKSLWIVAVLVCVAATGVWAQSMATFSPRAMGMGGAGIGVADDAAAWFQNPAGLAALNLQCKEGNEYANDALVGFADQDESNAWLISWSGWKPSDNIGFGAGYGDMEDVASAFGAGFGAGIKNIPLSLGINVMSVNVDGSGDDPAYDDGDDDQTILNFGAMYRFDQGEGKAPVRLGVTADDITEEFDRGVIWNAGIAWPATPELLIALDVNDLSEEIGDATFNGGAEYAFGLNKEWRGRAGLMDDGDETNFTVGFGYAAKNWRADFAWIDTDPESTWAVGVGISL